ncbi:hypothetical protein AVEN_101630-1 [Araneus ventricosus]|uniref:Uncharacterized protein n=1 Tax=Araneus ventricosus TaxID=182803 RepID=A0A4Y2EYK2_ARAVE|nr:hypothetical protein AVEN_101630-1 [Araneus ventricosus]
MSLNGEASASHLVLEQKRRFKFLLVGDPDCGKTRIIQTYLRNSAPKAVTHDPISTTYEYDLGGTNSNVEISLVDARGTYDISKASECFNSTNVAIFFYAINNLQSLENVRYCWIPRFRKCSGFNVPTILVGNKKDLRASRGLRSIASLQPHSVPFFHGMKTKNCCSMDMFLECSAEDHESIDCLFQAAYSYVI